MSRGLPIVGRRLGLGNQRSLLQHYFQLSVQDLALVRDGQVLFRIAVYGMAIICLESLPKHITCLAHPYAGILQEAVSHRRLRTAREDWNT